MSTADMILLLAKGKYGSTKPKIVILHVLNKILTFDIPQKQKNGGAIYSYDLKSCYNRIVHAFAALEMHRTGAARSATVNMFDTVQKLRHKVRTAFGDWDNTFGGET